MMEAISGGRPVSRGWATVLILTTSLLWSTGGLLIKLVNCHPLAISGIRSAIACLLLLVLIRKPRFNWSFPQVAGAVSYCAVVVTFVLATRLTTAANAIMLQFTAPIYVSLLGLWILKEKVGLLDVITMVLVLCGIFLFFLDGLSTGGLLGDVFGLISGISFACFFIFMRMQKEGSPIISVLLGNILAALVGLPFTFVQFPDAQSWLILVLLGVFQVGIPYILYSIAIRSIPALEAILICTLEPVLNPLWVLLVIGEVPGPKALIGGIIVIASITVKSIIGVRSNARLETTS